MQQFVRKKLYKLANQLRKRHQIHDDLFDNVLALLGDLHSV